jgi:hypothetical protein
VDTCRHNYLAYVKVAGSERAGGASATWGGAFARSVVPAAARAKVRPMARLLEAALDVRPNAQCDAAVRGNWRRQTPLI